jgi:hypothetical protein
MPIPYNQIPEMSFPLLSADSYDPENKSMNESDRLITLRTAQK